MSLRSSYVHPSKLAYLVLLIFQELGQGLRHRAEHAEAEVEGAAEVAPNLTVSKNLIAPGASPLLLWLLKDSSQLLKFRLSRGLLNLCFLLLFSLLRAYNVCRD